MDSSPEPSEGCLNFLGEFEQGKQLSYADFQLQNWGNVLSIEVLGNLIQQQQKVNIACTDTFLETEINVTTLLKILHYFPIILEYNSSSFLWHPWSDGCKLPPFTSFPMLSFLTLSGPRLLPTYLPPSCQSNPSLSAISSDKSFWALKTK